MINQSNPFAKASLPDLRELGKYKIEDEEDAKNEADYAAYLSEVEFKHNNYLNRLEEESAERYSRGDWE